MSERLKNLLSTQSYCQIPREYSGVEVYYLPELSAYLKIGEIAMNSNLGWERDVLSWIAGKASVPKLIDFEVVDGVECILISEISGQTYADHLAGCDNSSEIELFAETIAASIRNLHDLPIDDCYLDQRLDTKFKKAEENIRGGFVDESDFDEVNQGKSASQIFDNLISARPVSEDLVFTHGDLCLPNIILDEVGLSGFIDFDRGGVADRYQDIALFLRSFDLNSALKTDVNAAFCRGYDVKELDHDKLNFYRNLDELF